MKQKEKEKIYKRALDAWGEIPQLSMVLEEMAELQIELLKNMHRNSDNRIKIVDECADVEVVINYVKMIYNITEEELRERTNFKLNRLNERIDKWEKENK